MDILKSNNEKNRLTVILSLIFLFSIAAGSLCINFINTENPLSANNFIDSFISKRENAAFTSILISAFISNFMILIVLFLFGICIIGVPAGFIAAIIKGLGIGYSAGYLYTAYGFKGFIFNLIIIFPTAFLVSLVLITAAKESIKFSKTLLRIIKPDAKIYPLSSEFKIYLLRFTVLLLCLFIASAIDAAATVLFIENVVF